PEPKPVVGPRAPRKRRNFLATGTACPAPPKEGAMDAYTLPTLPTAHASRREIIAPGGLDPFVTARQIKEFMAELRRTRPGTSYDFEGPSTGAAGRNCRCGSAACLSAMRSQKA